MSEYESVPEVADEELSSRPETAGRQTPENQQGDRSDVEEGMSDTLSVDELSDPKVLENSAAGSGSRDSGARSEERRKRAPPDLSVSGGWAADAAYAEELKEAKAARKEARGVKRAARKAEVEEMRRRGDKPPQPCRNCRGDHWTDTCTAPTTMPPPPSQAPATPKRKRGKKRGRESAHASPHKNHRRSASSSAVSMGEGAKTAPLDYTSAPRPESSRASSVSRASTIPGGVELVKPPPFPAIALRQRKADAGAGAPKKAQPVPTRRQKAGGRSEVTDQSRFVDGKWLYLLMPAALRGSSAPATCQVVDALVNNNILEGGAFNECFSHDKKGWLVHCISRQLMAGAASKAFLILGKEATTSVYHTEGPCVFVAHRVGPASPAEKRPEVVRQITAVDALKGSKFWLGYLDYKFVVGSKLLLIFETSPGVHRFNVYVGDASVGFEKPFEVRFVMADQDKRCDFCHGEHLTRTCGQAAPVVLPLDHPCSNVLLGERPLDAQT